LPPRLPYLSSILRALEANQSNDKQYTIVGLSYRGFWQSKGKPSQQGIELDVEAALNWLLDRYEVSTKIIIWGQSIGAGAASVGLANLLNRKPGSINRISGLLLETPFVDLKTMLVALYPQKFLPYRYLTPFLRSSWDSKHALEEIGRVRSGLRTLILEAGDDEIVPAGQGAILEKVCKSQDIEVERATVPGALHTEVLMKSRGRSLIIGFLRSF
jgi:acetyl esterase/lipase